MLKNKFNFKSQFKILKGGKISLVVSALLGSVIIASASPSEGTVTSGTATISQNGSVTNIDQSTAKASINWQTFSIASGETVNFNQPSSSSITLNRVIGNEKSIIDGALNANGQVWLLNSNGVLFSKNASINTSGILATTAELSDSDFNAENYNFKNSSSNSVINQGTINVSNAGSVVLASNEVINEGTIKAVKGKVHLVGADSYSLNLNGNSLVNLRVDKGVLDAMVKNSGHIVADGGEIYLTTNAVDELLKGVVNNTGIIEANSIDDLFGKVELFAHGGTAEVDGRIEALGGFVETSGRYFNIEEGSSIKAGEWLIDPVDITIDDASAYETSLNAGTNVTIETQASGSEDGNINVNDEIEWSTANTLTFKAHNNININKEITATNDTGKLALHYGQANVNANNDSTYNVNAAVNLKAGNNFETKLGTDGTVTSWSVLTDKDALQGMTVHNSSKNYALGSNLTLSGENNWVPLYIFKGKFDGLGHTISNVHINNPSKPYQGLFGYTNGATIKNIGLINTNITGNNYVGSVVGYNRDSTITNSYSTGTVNSQSHFIGGLVGYNNNSTVTNSYFTGIVNGQDNFVGGLVGLNAENSIIVNSYASGTASGNSTFVGGLVGLNHSTITNSFYDKETNQASMYDASLGKTKAEITALVTNGTWDANFWGTNGSEANGYVNNNSLPFLKGVTDTLFKSGFGTEINPYIITNWTQLQNINNSNILTNNKYFNLANNIDNTTSGYSNLASSTTNSNKGWEPIGNSSQFRGTFDGLGNTISDLYISRLEDNIGLFGYTSTSIIKNIGLLNVDISGREYVGGLVGVGSSTVTNSYVTGDVSGSGNFIGGLIGQSWAPITNSFTEVNVDGSNHVGGLVGNNRNKTTNSYSTGTVSGIDNIGGLVGLNDNWVISSYSIGNVQGNNQIGGLVGNNQAAIKNSYTIGVVNGSGNNIGGLAGYNRYSPVNSFYNSSVNSTGMSDTNYGKTTNELQNIATFTTDIITSGERWSISEDSTLPSTYLYPVLVTNNGVTSWKIYKAPPVYVTYTLSDIISGYVYKGNDYNLNDLWSSNTIFVGSYDSWIAGTDYNFIYNTNVATGFTNAGTYSNISVDILKSGFKGASSGNTEGSLVIDKKDLAVTYTASNKIYDATTNATVTESTSDVISGDTVTISESAAFSDKNVASGKTVNVSSIALAGTDAANYNLTNTTANTTADITAKDLAIDGLVANSKVYDGTTSATYKSLGTISGLVSGETLKVSGTVTFNDKDVLDANTVTASNYVLSDGSGASSNYNLITTSDTAEATIQKANATVTANSDTVTYNGLTQTVSGFSASGLVNGETTSVLDNVLASKSGLNAGTYTAVASGTDENYNLTFVDGSLTIAKANATVTANSDTKTYNGLTQTVSGFTASGLVNNETTSVLDNVLASKSGLNAGTYTAVASGTDENYNLTFVDGSLTIAKANATVTANSDTTKVYNGLTQTVSGFTASGLVNNETTSVLDNVLASKSGLNAGTYTAVASGTDENYNLTFVDGSLTIAKANATVIANSDTTKVYNGLTQTVSGFTASGLVNNETTSVLDNVLASKSGLNAGTYTAVASGTDENYNLTFVDGSLTIAKADATVTANSDTTKVYNGLTQTVSGFTASGLVNNETTSVLDGVSASKSGLNAGTYTAVASGTDENYNLTFVDGTLTITPKGITVSADDLSKVYGQTDVALTYSTTGLETGDTLAGSLKRAAGEDVNSVGYAISQDTALTNSNYTVTFTDGKYTITPRPITLVANESSKVYGGSESELTATVSSTAGLGLASSDTIKDVIGILSRESGETVGSYDVLLGDGEKASNYSISYNSDNNSYTITPSTTNLVNVTLPTAPAKVVVNNNPNIVSQPAAEEVATQIVTLSEIKTNQENSQTNDGSQTPQDVRVPVSKNSIIELVNGGVNLPSGVDQQFFVVATTETQEN